MKKIIAILMMCCLFGINDSHAQLGKLKDKINAKKKQISKQVERRLERKVDRKIDEKIDDAFKKKEKDSDSEDGTTTSGGGMNIPTFGKSEPLNEVYNFDTQVRWKARIPGDKKGEVQEMEYWQLFQDGGSDFGMEMGHEGHEIFTVMDMEKQISISVISDQNMAMITELPKEIPDGIEENNDFDDRKISFSKTGRKEKIAGYMSEEYAWEDLEEGVSGTIWFTDEIGIDGRKAMGLFKSAKTVKLPNGLEIKGYTMRITGKSKEGESYHAEVQEYKKAKRSIDMSNYQTMRINSGMMEKMMKRGQKN